MDTKELDIAINAKPSKRNMRTTTVLCIVNLLVLGTSSFLTGNCNGKAHRLAVTQRLWSHSHDGAQSNSKDGDLRLRLNKVFKRTHSRRAADDLIKSGRVMVNGKAVETQGGFFVKPFRDTVSLDGKVVVGWEEMNGFTAARTATRENQGRTNKERARVEVSSANYEYIKFWKPCGVVCTTDQSVSRNIVHELNRLGYNPPHRVYPVGRLDKDTSGENCNAQNLFRVCVYPTNQQLIPPNLKTGLILLTSDGRLPNAALKNKKRQPKTYEVVVHRPLHWRDVKRLEVSNAQTVTLLALAILTTAPRNQQEGVTITTEIARDGVRRTLTAPTLPCEIHQIDDYKMEMTIVEGR